MIVHRKGIINRGISEGSVLFRTDFMLRLVWGEVVCFVTRDGGSAFARLGGSACYGVNLGIPSSTGSSGSREVSPDALSFRRTRDLGHRCGGVLLA